MLSLLEGVRGEDCLKLSEKTGFSSAGFKATSYSYPFLIFVDRYEATADTLAHIILFRFGLISECEWRSGWRLVYVLWTEAVWRFKVRCAR